MEIVKQVVRSPVFVLPRRHRRRRFHEVSFVRLITVGAVVSTLLWSLWQPPGVLGIRTGILLWVPMEVRWFVLMSVSWEVLVRVLWSSTWVMLFELDIALSGS